MGLRASKRGMRRANVEIGGTEGGWRCCCVDGRRQKKTGDAIGDPVGAGRGWKSTYDTISMEGNRR